MMSGQALDGLRVIDLSYSYAGPYLTKLLADMGAEVIKIEACQRPELTRPLILAENDPKDEYWNRAGYFNKGHRNKCAITLDLNNDRAKDIFKDLVKIADVVVEAYSPRVMFNFGLDYPVLKELKPDIIMLSLSGYGQTGPYRDYASFGTVMESMSGITELTGYPDGPPMKSGISYCDPIVGIIGAGLVLAALHYRRKTGKGQHIDLSMHEAGISLIGEVLMDFTMNRRVSSRTGNRHPSMAPHGCYRCRGEDVWITIAISSDQEWEKFCEAIGNPSWTKEERFTTTLGRWQNQEELNRLIEAWTSQHDHYEAMHILQGVGVIAGPVLTNKELLFDPHLKERGFFEVVDHPSVGKRPYAGMAFKLSKTPGRIRTPAPLLGEHNQRILKEYLGLSKEEISKLEEENVIGSAPIIEYPIELVMQLIVSPLDLLEKLGAVVRVDPDYLEQLGLK